MLSERRSGLLAVADREALMSLADELIGVHGEPTVVTSPEVVLVALDVREPVCRERFRVGDVLVTRAEVAFGDREGWAVRMGDDREATLAAAICSAVSDHALAGREGVDDLCRRTEQRQADDRLAEWSELLETVVEFEELD